MIHPRFASIRTQLVLGIVLVLSFIGLAVLIVLPRFEHQVMRRAELEKLGGVAEAIAWFVAPGLDFSDPEFVAENIEYFFTLPEVYGIEVYDRRGELYCAAGDPYPESKATRRGLIRVSSPVMHDGSELGTVVLITRSEALEAALRLSRIFISTITLVCICLGGLAAILLGKSMLRPVLDLHDATRAIGDGDLGVRVAVRGSTELQDLAHAFNLMTERLRKTTTSRDHLEKEVEEKQRALEEVRRLKERAEELARVKSEFLANMSHEIRTPMNGILGLTELVLDSDLETTQRSYLNGVLEAGRHLLAILNDVLDLSKIEAGKLEVAPVTTDLADLISSLGIQHGTVAHSKGLRFHVSLGAGVPRFVIADGLRIRQVLANLVGNAIKFTTAGHVRVDVRSEGERGASHCQIRFSVVDTGIGISHSKREAIFQPFQQADGSTTRNFGGTGLGLTISLRLVHAMGGAIELESELDQGSEFSFSLALARATIGDEPAWATSLRGIRPNVRVELTDAEVERTVLANLGFWEAQVVSDPAGADLEIQDVEHVRSGVAEPGTAVPAARERSTSMGALTSSPGRSELPRIRVVGAPDASRRARYEREVAGPFGPLELGAALWHGLGGGTWPEAATVPGTTPPASVRPLRILVAEDNRTNQMVVMKMLERLGHDVSLVENGNDAVDLALQQDFDLVLMDWHMPVMNGLEATISLRKQGSRVRIVALTANALPGDRDLCLEAGMNGYLSKPIRRAELERLLEEAARSMEDPGTEGTQAA